MTYQKEPADTLPDHADHLQNDARTCQLNGTTLTQPILSSFFDLPTSRGPVFVDESDRELVSQYSWYAVEAGEGKFYAQARVPLAGKRVSMHRLLMQPPAGFVVHHKNNNGLDNRRSNLEITTVQGNNRYAREGKETGAYLRENGKWSARVRRPDGQLVNLGSYATREAALSVASAYKAEIGT